MTYFATANDGRKTEHFITPMSAMWVLKALHTIAAPSAALVSVTAVDANGNEQLMDMVAVNTMYIAHDKYLKSLRS